MSYKAIIFDLDNTLLNFEICERQAIIGGLQGCEIFLDSYGVAEPHFLEIFEFYNSQYWKQRESFTPNELIEKSYQDALAQFNIRPASMSQLSQTYWYIFNHSKIMESGACEVLNILVRSYRLAVITNGLTSTQLSRMRAAAIDRYFEVVVVSEAK
jgi:FMN phosphatase YigB (HAD superfamily)